MTALDLVRKVGKRLGHLVICGGCHAPMRVLAMLVADETRAEIELRCRCDSGCGGEEITFLRIDGQMWDEAMIKVPAQLYSETDQ